MGQIQGYGFVLVVEEIDDTAAFPSGFCIVGASRNVVTAPWIDASSTADICGEDLGHVFHEHCLKTVCSLVVRHKNTQTPSPEHLSAKANPTLITPARHSRRPNASCGYPC